MKQLSKLSLGKRCARRLALVAALTGGACSHSQMRAEGISTSESAEEATNLAVHTRKLITENDQVPPEKAELNSVASETPEEPETEAEQEPEPVLPSGTTVLHIGDSMAWSLGGPLSEIFEEAGLKSILRSRTATYIPTWANDGSLSGHLRYHDPDLVLISLGANEVQIYNPGSRAKTIQRLVARLEGRPCVWIAPPLWDDGDTGLLPVIRDNCAPCRYMDTNALVHNMPRYDGIHPSTKARPVWAGFVADWLMRQRDLEGESAWDLLPPSEEVEVPTLDFSRLGELK